LPILAGAGFPVTDIPTLPTTQDTSRLDTRTLAFRAFDGSYPFAPTGREFFFTPDLDGLDLNDPELITRPVPGMAGALISEIRDPIRELSLPLFVHSNSSHADYLDKRDALAALFSHRHWDYRKHGGTFDLIARSIRGVRYLRCVYTGGMKAIKRPGEGPYWAKLPITAVAVQPFWVGEGWSTPPIRQEVEPDWFAEFPGDLSTSTTLGTFPLYVSGDVESWPTIDLIGPATSVTVVSDSGLYFEIPSTLVEGETVKVITNPRLRTALFDGVKNWARVGPTTTWQPLPPGDQTLTVAITGTTSATRAQVSGDSFYERPW
jgi:hypothetical protein